MMHSKLCCPKSLRITNSEVKVMFNLVPTLDLMSEAINIMGGEKYSTLSATLPWLIKFIGMLQTSDKLSTLESLEVKEEIETYSLLRR